MIIEKASHSRLQTFKHCQLQYRFKYNDKLESTLPKPEYFEFGHFIHKTFELVIQDKLPISEAAAIARKEFCQFGIKYSNRIPNMLNNFKKFQDMIYSQKDLEITHEETEGEFNILLNERHNVNFNGFIDRKINYSNGNILIIDYKTSQKRNQVNKFKINQDPQLMTYIWATHKKYDIDIERIAAMLFYLDSGDKLVSRPDKRRVSLYIQDCDRLVDTIKSMKPENAKANVTKLCNFCEFRNICPHFSY